MDNPQRHPQLVLCKCLSHCTVYNPSTGLVEGSGFWISRTNRNAHSRDDRLQQAARLPTSRITVIGNRSWENLYRAEVDALKKIPLSSRKFPLIFKNSPQANGPFNQPLDEEIVIPNYGLYALTPSRSNKAFLEVEARYCQLVSLAGQMQPSDGRTELIDTLYLELRRLCREKQVHWTLQRSAARAEDICYVNTEMHYSSVIRTDPRTVGSLISSTLQFIFFVPVRALRVHLAALRSLMRAAGVSEKVIQQVPKDPQTASKIYDLLPVTTQYTVCPKCNALYPYVPNNAPVSLQRCTFRQTPTSEVCDTGLWKTVATLPGHEISIPAKRYLHHDLKSWLGRLLSRKGIEDILDSRPFIPPGDGSIDDIWLSKHFQELKDPSGAPFYPGNGEGRLVFGLAVDGFNPFQNKTAKQSVSSTAIWLVLLNLPPELRYLHENIYVAGVISGHPSSDQINHYIDLLVDELLVFWQPGVFFSRTQKSTIGRLYRAMLIPLICDMIAARHVLGQPPPTAHNCCTLCDADLHDIHITDSSEWPEKDSAHVRRCAMLWKDAVSEAERDFLYQAFGHRWSPLLRLPYWDPVKYAVVDSMHTLDLGLLSFHCRQLFGIDSLKNGGDGSSSAPHVGPGRVVTSREEKRQLRNCTRLIHNNPDELHHELLRFGRRVLYTFCVEYNVVGMGHTVIIGTRQVLANNILEWVSGHELFEGLLFTYFQRRGPDYHEEAEDEIDQEEGPDQGEEPDANALDTSPVLLRVMKNLLMVENQEENRRRAYTQGTTEHFKAICSMLRIDVSDIDTTRTRTAKRVLSERIITFVSEILCYAPCACLRPGQLDDNTQNRRILQAIVDDSSKTPASRTVLGKDVLEEVWSDMARTILPSWVTPAPPNWGTAARGKLSASNWRVICTIHLPITLIRLWKGDNGRKAAILNHFMDLVSAVRIANMRISSPQQVAAYNQYIKRYVSRITVLYPDRALRPTHHGALHLGDVIENFGPVHAHSAPFFERYINFFHQMNTNQKIGMILPVLKQSILLTVTILGELERTMLNTSASSANLRAILSDNDEVRHLVCELTEKMDNIALQDARGFRLASILNPNIPNATSRFQSTASIIDEQLHGLLMAICGPGARVQQEATFYQEISIQGVCYAVFNSAKYRNSHILFWDVTEQKAGKIERIFRGVYSINEQVTDEIFLVVRQINAIAFDEDPYRKFAFAGFLAEPNGGALTVVRMAQVICHCVITEMADNAFAGLVHVLPVDRLMKLFETGEWEEEEDRV